MEIKINKNYRTNLKNYRCIKSEHKVAITVISSFYFISDELSNYSFNKS